MSPDTDHAAAVVVLGAGPAGLALGAALQRRGISFQLLERGEGVGHSWRQMPTHLKLLSPWKANWLEPDDAPRFPSNREITRDEFANYLEDFARVRRIPVRTDVEVHAVERGANGGFLLRTSVGLISAPFLVNATGSSSAPWRPVIPGAKVSPILQLHSAEFRDAETLRSRLGETKRPILIVGQRLPAGQTLVELVDAGFSVALSHRGPLEFGPGPLIGWAFFRLHPWLEARALRQHGAAARGFTPKMQGGRARKLIEGGTVKIFPAIACFDGDTVVFTDGSSLEPAAVIFATGFRAALRHLAPLHLALDQGTGRPALNGFESADAPGLFFLGLDGQVNFQSRFLRGIRQDAPCLAAELALRLEGARPSQASSVPVAEEPLPIP